MKNKILSVIICLFLIISGFHFLVEGGGMIIEDELSENEHSTDNNLTSYISSSEFENDIINDGFENNIGLSKENSIEDPDTNSITRYLTDSDVDMLKSDMGIYQPGKNYNILIDGYGTGLAPPTEDEYKAMVNSTRIVDDIRIQDSLPTSLDHSTSQYFPPVGNQGSQGSCTSFATVYYANTFMQAQAYGWDASTGDSQHIMSPSWAYNKVNYGEDEGSHHLRNMMLTSSIGTSNLNLMPYNEYDYISWGEESAWRNAPQHRAIDYETTNIENIDVIKSWLNEGYLVTMSMDANQYSNMDSNYIFTTQNYNPGNPNHANTIVGYDDTIVADGEEGAFKIVNSWGSTHLDNGFYHMTYDCFQTLDWSWVYRYTGSMYDSESTPELIARVELDPIGPRDASIELGIGSPANPLETHLPWLDGGTYNFPSFMCFDLGDFQEYWDGGKGHTKFFLEIYGGSGSSTISSFGIERYIHDYSPGWPDETSGKSPYTPVNTPAIVLVDFDNDLHPRIRINDNADFIMQADMYGWPGDGTEEDPFIIENKHIYGYGAGYCIYIGNTTSHFKVRNNHVERASGNHFESFGNSGIYLYNVINGVLENNTVIENVIGIYLYNVIDGVLENNTVLENGYAMLIENSESNTISDNSIYKNEVGILLFNSDSNILLDNNLSSNTGLDIYLYWSEYITMSNNLMENGIHILGYQLSYWNTHSIDTSNTVNRKPVYYLKDETGGTVPKGAGQIILANCSDVVIENQNMDSVCGILVGFSDYNTISNNTLSNNHFGIQFINSNINTLKNNVIYSNLRGVGIEESYGNSIIKNKMSYNEFAVSIYDSNDNTIAGNELSNNDIGIDLIWSDSNFMTNNTLSCNEYGVYIDGEYNYIYHNNFINNENHAYADEINFWDNGYPSGGNYWSDHTEPDEYSGPGQDEPGSDGIVDEPYYIFGDHYVQMDPYPFTIPNGWEVSKPVQNLNTEESFATIQKAIDDPNTLDGHSIHVWSGVYNEDIVIDKQISLIGNGSDETIIYGNRDESVVNITSDKVTFRGFGITHSMDDFTRSGIKLSSVKDCTIEFNKIFDNPYNHGVFLYDSSNNILANNTLSNNWMGMCLYDSENNYISSNKLSKNSYGIYISECNANSVSNNILSMNSFADIHVDNSEDLVISNNTMDRGIFLFGDELIHWNTHSIDTLNTVDDRTVYYLKDETSGTVPKGAGQIILANCSDVVIENQNMDGAGISISVGFSYSNDIINNKISNNYFGIYLFESENNTFTKNSISNNMVGINLHYSDGNHIYHNNFINNENHAFADGVNIWDNGYPSGGNYWSDHIEPDEHSGPGQDEPGSDGIVDESYLIDGGENIDNYPWTTQDGWLVTIDISLIAGGQANGWNFISFTIDIDDNQLESILEHEDYGITGSYDRVMYYDTTVGKWLSYMPDRADHFNDDIEWDYSMGLWVRMTNNATLTVEGTELTNRNITIYPGWNMIGYPSDIDRTAEEVFPSEVSKLGLFNPESEYNIEYVLSGIFEHILLKKGNGYWVYNEADYKVTLNFGY